MIDSIPIQLVVVGGGVICLEFACIYEALGSHVTVLEMAPTLLTGATDEALAERLAVLLRRRGVVVATSRTVLRIARSGDSLTVYTKGPDGESVFEGDRVLLATGRWPNTSSLGLEKLGLEMRGRAIAVDQWMATNIDNVWAIGDAVGGTMLAHKAMVEGRVAAENATGGERSVDYRSVPNVIFTRPEVASAGLTEQQARARGAEVKISQFPFSANPRAQILREKDGLPEAMLEAALGFRGAAIHGQSR
jgi:dihydrolipoamide dehydrogenase